MAFTAFNSDRTLHTASEQIEFDGVETNVGGHFNASTFTCPVDGLYVFSFAILGDYNYNTEVSLRLDGHVVVSGKADRYNNYPHGSNLAVVSCDVGQEVYLQCEFSGYMYSDEFRYVTFSGFLLSEN